MARIGLNARLSAAAAAAGLLVLAACSDTTTTAAPQMSAADPVASKSVASDDVVEGEVIVKLKDGTTTTIDEVASKHKAKKDKKGYGNKFDVVKTNKGGEAALAAELSADPDVEYAEPNYIRHVDAIDSRLWAFY